MNHDSAMQVRSINGCVEIVFCKRELRSETQANSNVLINRWHNCILYIITFKGLMNEEMKKHTFLSDTFPICKKGKVIK